MFENVYFYNYDDKDIIKNTWEIKKFPNATKTLGNYSLKLPVL